MTVTREEKDAPPASGDAPGSGRATAERLAQLYANPDYPSDEEALADEIERALAAEGDRRFREGLERAAKVADDAKAEFHGVDGWAAVAVKRIADNIRSLINEVSP